MYITRKAVAIACDGSGDCTAYSDAVTGRILGIRVVVPQSGGIANTSDITITAETTGEAIVTLTNQNGSASYYPRVGICDTSGAAALYAAGGTAVREPVALDTDRVKIVVAQGGASGAATIYVIVG